MKITCDVPKVVYVNIYTSGEAIRVIPKVLWRGVKLVVVNCAFLFFTHSTKLVEDFYNHGE